MNITSSTFYWPERAQMLRVGWAEGALRSVVELHVQEGGEAGMLLHRYPVLTSIAPGAPPRNPREPLSFRILVVDPWLLCHEVWSKSTSLWVSVFPIGKGKVLD